MLIKKRGLGFSTGISYFSTKNDMDKNVVGWIEIPAIDLDRAQKFYEEVLGLELERHTMGPLEMAWFPWIEDAVGSPASLVKMEEFYKPSTDGVLIYFTSPSGDVDNELARVEQAGGKLLRPKTHISDEHGYYGLLLDTEGNRMAFHSRQ
jgi:predicted enzyme related to lactoylglutathione lyase